MEGEVFDIRGMSTYTDMSTSPKPGRRPGGAELSATEKRVSEVVEIVRRLGGPGKVAVRFSQVYPELKPPAGSKNPTLWQRTSAWRALERARRQGLLERTPKGYRDRESPFFAFQGIKIDLDEELKFAAKLLSLHAGLNPKGIDYVRKAIPGFGQGLLATMGSWLRAIDDALREKAMRLGVELESRDIAAFAAELAQSLVTGYLIPEYKAAGALESDSDFRSRTDPTTRMKLPSVEEIERLRKARESRSDEVRAGENLSYLWFRVSERFVGTPWPLPAGVLPGSARLLEGERLFSKYSNG